MASPRIDRLDRNYLMNAGFDYWQRATVKLVGNGSVEYVADRWIMGPGIDENVGSQTTYARDTVVPNANTFYSARATGSYVAGEEISMLQRVESIFARNLSNKKVSLGFWVRSESATQVRVKFITPASSNDNYSSQTLISSEIVTITNDSNWQFIKLENRLMPNIDKGLQILITFIASGTGSVTHWLAQPQLNLGEFCQEFKLFGKDALEELSFCERYFEKSYELDVQPGTSFANGNFFDIYYQGGSTVRKNFKLNTRKRTPPSGIIYSLDGTPNVAQFSGTNYTSSLGGTDVYGILTSTGVIPGTGTYDLRFHYTADAEI